RIEVDDLTLDILDAGCAGGPSKCKSGCGRGSGYGIKAEITLDPLTTNYHVLVPPDLGVFNAIFPKNWIDGSDGIALVSFASSIRMRCELSCHRATRSDCSPACLLSPARRFDCQQDVADVNQVGDLPLALHCTSTIPEHQLCL